MDKKQITKAEKITEELLELLGVNAKPILSVGEDIIDINLETEESGILIGYHGETLEAIQLILSLCIARELGAFYRVSVEIGDYKKNRIDYLSPTLFVNDIPILIAFIYFLIKRKIHLKITFLLVVAYLSLSAFFSQSPFNGWYGLLKFLEFSFFIFWVSGTNFKTKILPY